MLQEKERRSKVSFAPAWCKRGDSNSHGGCHTHLKRACLPIPTLLQLTYSLIIIANPVDFVNSFFGKSQGLLNLLFCRAWGDGFPWRPHPTPRRADRYYGTSPIGAQRLCIYLFSEQVCDCINENSASQRAAKRKYGGPNPGCGRPGVRKEKKFGIFYLPLDKEN